MTKRKEGRRIEDGRGKNVKIGNRESEAALYLFVFYYLSCRRLGQTERGRTKCERKVSKAT